MRFKFENLFGIAPDTVRPLCILTPFLTKFMIHKLNLSKRFSGKPYSCFQKEQFTLIETRMGSLFTGDAVLCLEETPCEKVILIGACGSLNEVKFPIGRIVSPQACYAIESFTDMLQENFSDALYLKTPGGSLSSCHAPIEPVTCASIGSIILENRNIQKFRDLEIDVLEMECASVFSAAAKIQRRAHALLYVTDIIGKTSPYEIAGQDAINAIERAQSDALDVLLEITQT